MITFIIPAYQAEATLKRTIDSVLCQNSGRWKMILINDGSTDSTADICSWYHNRYPEKITYISQENQGLGHARNVGIGLVKSEYMCFLDSDDWLMPDFVEKVTFYGKNYSPEVIFTLPVIWHEGSNTVRDWYDKQLFECLFPEDGTVIVPEKNPEIYTMEVNACRKILAADFVKKTGFFFPEGIKWEDVYPHFFLLSQCKAVLGIKSAGFYYRIGSTDQITASKGRDRLDILPIFEQLLNYIEEENRQALRFPAMRIFVRFSIWCIRMTEGELRRELVQRLTEFFRRVPKSYFRILQKEIKNKYSKADRRQYALFLLAIRYRAVGWVFYDYFYEEAAEKLVKKVLKAKERVS